MFNTHMPARTAVGQLMLLWNEVTSRIAVAVHLMQELKLLHEVLLRQQYSHFSPGKLHCGLQSALVGLLISIAKEGPGTLQIYDCVSPLLGCLIIITDVHL